MKKFYLPCPIFWGVFLCLTWLFQCSLHYDKLIHKTENYFFQSDFDTALSVIRPIAQNSSKKDLLLYLLETALIYHTQKKYAKSNELFRQADNLVEKASKSISQETLAFLLNDHQKDYFPENFERVLIKFYIALNYLFMSDLEPAYRYFKKLQFSLKDLKYSDASYKQNLMARYLNAILAEHFGNYNDARVEYKNITNFHKNKGVVTSEQYILAIRERDQRDIKRFSGGKSRVKAYNKALEQVAYNQNMGELVMIHQAGKTVVKKSRGLLKNDPAFIAALYIAIRVAIASEKAGLAASGVMSTFYAAENPIPIYKFRDHRRSWGLHVYLDQKKIGSTFLLNDYSKTVIKNFNGNYKQIINKNVASIALKAVSATIASYVAKKGVSRATGNSAIGTLAGIVTGVVTGSVLGSTIKPDLRCWHLLPSNFQVNRIFLEPGEYDLTVQPKDGGRILTHSPSQKVKISKGGLVFINVRSI